MDQFNRITASRVLELTENPLSICTAKIGNYTLYYTGLDNNSKLTSILGISPERCISLYW
jgi:hypothetical protein